MKQNKRNRDNAVAHSRRLRDLGELQLLFDRSGLCVEKISTSLKSYSPAELVLLNQITNRYPSIKPHQVVGHSFRIHREDDPNKFIYAEIRHKSDWGLYYKSPRDCKNAYDLLKSLGSIFLVPLYENDTERIQSIALLTMNNPYMKRIYWEKSTSDGNENRWNNTKIRVKSLTGYNMPGEKQLLFDEINTQIDGRVK